MAPFVHCTVTIRSFGDKTMDLYIDWPEIEPSSNKNRNEDVTDAEKNASFVSFPVVHADAAIKRFFGEGHDS